MSSIFIFLLFLLIVVFIIALVVINGILNFIFTLFGVKPSHHAFFRAFGRSVFEKFQQPRNTNTSTAENSNTSSPSSDNASQSSSSHSSAHTGRQKEKIFHRDDSEYVDFEEVK